MKATIVPDFAKAKNLEQRGTSHTDLSDATNHVNQTDGQLRRRMSGRGGSSITRKGLNVQTAEKVVAETK